MHTIQTVLFVFESTLTELKHYHSEVVLRIEFLRRYFKKYFSRYILTALFRVVHGKSF